MGVRNPKVVGDPEAHTLYMPRHQAAIVTEKKRRSTSPRIKEPEDGKISGNIVSWGTMNDFPQQLYEKGRKNTIIAPVLNQRVNTMYGRGLRPFLMDGYDEGGYEKLIPLPLDQHPEIKEFIKRSDLNQYILEAAMDFYWFLNVFPELVLSKDRKKIVQIAHQEAMFCRWEEMDKNGRVNHCYINANWPDLDTDYVHKVATIDPYSYSRYEELREGNQWKYIYPLSYPTPGKTYYQLVTWYSAIESGWYDVAQEIPKWKKALMKNQISVKFMVKVPRSWWAWKYKGFEEKSPEERLDIMTEEYNEFEKFLAGAENAGKSIMTTYRDDVDFQKAYPHWEIQSIGDQMKDGQYIEDSQEATWHLLHALERDPSSAGFKSGKSQSTAGSGSDKRVAYNTYVSTIEPHRNIMIKPLDFIRDYNGWPEELRWRFLYDQINTLQGGAETTEKTQ